MMEATTHTNLLLLSQMEATNAVVVLNEVRQQFISPDICTDSLTAQPLENGEKRRKKRNRWGDAAENKAAGLMGLPTMIKANMTNEQLEAYTLHLRIQEISEKLRINDVVPADGDRYFFPHRRVITSLPYMVSRSPSPPPQYDNFGRRVNTREYRYRKRLEDERHKQIEKAMKIIPDYHPPSDYRRPTKTQEKVYVPVNDYPEINFSMITNPLTPKIFFYLVLLFYSQ